MFKSLSLGGSEGDADAVEERLSGFFQTGFSNSGSFGVHDDYSKWQKVIEDRDPGPNEKFSLLAEFDMGVSTLVKMRMKRVIMFRIDCKFVFIFLLASMILNMTSQVID